MTDKTKAADQRKGQAAFINVQLPQSNYSTSNAVSIAFILPINDRYRLTADEYAWRIEKRTGKRRRYGLQ
jgi:hypothetical protein